MCVCVCVCMCVWQEGQQIDAQLTILRNCLVNRVLQEMNNNYTGICGMCVCGDTCVIVRVVCSVTANTVLMQLS